MKKLFDYIVEALAVCSPGYAMTKIYTPVEKNTKEGKKASKTAA